MERSSDAVIAGVLGGLANNWDMDPTIVRVVYVILTLITGIVPGILVYLILYLVMDEAPPESTT